MNALIRFSIKHCGFVALVSLLWLIISLFISRKAPLDVFPEFVPPQVTIQTEAPGLAPELVEQIVTRPIESAVIGSPNITSVRSESVYGLSVVLITFDEDADPIISRQAVAERLTSLSGKLPMEAGSPKLTPLTSSTMDVVKIGLVSDTVDPYALRELADWIIKPRLLSESGIARVTVYGGAVRQIHIQPQMGRITALGLSISDLTRAAREALPLRGGGVIETSSQRVVIHTPPPLADPNSISETIVAVQNGLAIKIKDLARVTFAPALKVGDATIMGRPGVLITVSAKFGANTLLATKGVENALNEIEPLLEKKNIILYPSLHRPASFVTRSISNLVEALTLGSILILIVLFLFLRNVRAALISFVAIPLSLLSTVVILAACGQTINTMTLGGFALALGVLVDDAIIDIENITRRLRLAEASGRSDRVGVIEEASIEIRGSMFYGTLAIIFVFIPILFIGGVQGRFIGPMALTFILAVAASMIVAITVTPALSALFLVSHINTEEPQLLYFLKRQQTTALDYVKNYWRTTLFVLTLGAVSSAAIIPYLHSELIPQFREGHFVLQMSSATSGASIDEVTELGERISNSLLKLPFIETVAHQIGRAEIGEDTWSPDRSEFHIELKSEHDETEEEAQNIIRDTLKKFPEVRSETLTFLGDRVSESLSGETAQVVINVIGSNLDAIEQAASKIFRAIEFIPGVTDLRIPKSSKVPMISVKIDPRALSRYFLTPQDLLDSVQTAFSGAFVAQTYSENRTIDVYVMLPPEERNRISTLNTLIISNGTSRVLLREVADISFQDGRSNIEHEGGQRRIALTFNGEEGYSLNEVVHEVKKSIKQVDVPNDVFVSFAGQAEAEREGQLRIAGLTALSIILTISALAMAFRRRVLSVLILINLPFCLIGCIIAILISNVGLTLGSLVGLVTVFGIGARNSVMMLAHIEHLLDVEDYPLSPKTIQTAALERLNPVFMTALMAALGLIPLALGLGRPGHEIEAPMAITILGGLTTSTLLNLVILPEFLKRYGSFFRLKYSE